MRNSTNSDLRSKFEMHGSVDYLNELPEIAFSMKMFPYPFDMSQFTEYNNPHFSKEYKRDDIIDCDHTLGIDFMNLEKYKKTTKPLDEEDLLLLVDNVDPVQETQSNKSVIHKNNVSWLRNAEYTSSEVSTVKKIHENRDIELTENLKNYKKTRAQLKSVDKQIQVIEKSFSDPMTHAKKPKNVKPVKEFPLFPNFEIPSESYCAHIVFDSHPVVSSIASESAISEHYLENSLLKGLNDDDGEYVGYFVSTAAPPMSSTSAQQTRKSFNYYENTHGLLMIIQEIYAIYESGTNTFVYTKVPTRIKLIKRVKPHGSKPNNNNNNQSITLIVEESQTNSTANNSLNAAEFIDDLDENNNEYEYLNKTPVYGDKMDD